MSYTLRLGLIIVGLLIFIITLSLLKKDRIPVKYSLVWLFSGLIILFLALIPNLFGFFSKVLGFAIIANMVVGIFVFILLMITISLTVIVSGQKKKITLLIQEVSMLKGKNIDNNKVFDKDDKK